jgi:two-component system nitrogen regulation sensor histidine kinase NtrY
MSPSVNRPRLAEVLNRRLSAQSVRVGVFLSFIFGIGIGFLLIFNQFRHQQSLINALKEDVLLLSQSSDSREIERMLGSFNEAMPDSRFLFVRDGQIEVSIPDMQLAQTAFIDPKLVTFLGMKFTHGWEMYSSIPLQDESNHAQYGELILTSPARPAILSALLITLLSLMTGAVLLVYMRRLSKQVLGETLKPLELLHADLKRVGKGGAPSAAPDLFDVRELSDISDLVERQYQDVLRLTEVSAQIEGEKMAKEAVRSLLHDMLNPYTALSNLVQSRIRFPEDEEIRAELEDQWQSLDAQIRTLIKAARHLDIEKVNAQTEDIQKTIETGVQMGAVKKPGSIKRISTSPEPITVRHDPELIARAVANLVRNSVEEGASAVEVWCELKPLSIHIRDNGPGISPEKVAPLFEGRLKSSKTDGSGIGFPTALRLIKMHGGKIYLEKGPQPGAHFRIDLSCLEGIAL